ncbi:MAG TPA: hypothetical protein VG735_09165 [Caulobacterales bacterium]|jgi:hypothetical protein|nr:hypothetical protein [Caulobacterales bacterium]
MKSRLAALALAACLALAGCFVSDKPLFNGAGDPVFGRGLVTVTTFEAGSAPDTGQMRWTPQGYIEPDDNDKNVMTFHHLPGGGWFSPWYVGQAGVSGDGKGGYMYMLYRKDGDRLITYDLSCSDLTADEAAAAHLVRSDSGSECTATRPEDLAAAFRLLAKRKPSKGYMIAKPAS